MLPAVLGVSRSLPKLIGVIADSTLRHIVCVTPTALIAHDRRWRRRKELPLLSGSQVIEGRTAIMVIADDPDAVRVEIRRATDIGAVEATGTYENWQWTFDGDKSAFGEVPEYLVLPRPSGNVFLRIADGAVLGLLDAAQGLATMTHVSAVPDSRLVVLSDGNRWAIYDPKTTQAGYHSELANPSDNAVVAFTADAKRMLMCDRSSLLTLSTTDWAVEDAAGVEGDGEASAISSWDFDLSSSQVAVGHDNGEVFVIDVVTMEAVQQVDVGFSPTAIAVRGDRLFAQRPDGTYVERRLKSP